MARRRSLHKSISQSKKVNITLSELAEVDPLNTTRRPRHMIELCQLVYTWMIPHLDDYGVIDGDPSGFKLVVMPGTKRPVSHIESALIYIAHAGLIHYYAVGCNRYAEQFDFEEKQDGLHKRKDRKSPDYQQVKGLDVFLDYIDFECITDAFREIPGNSGKIPLERKGKEKEIERKEEDKLSSHDEYMEITEAKIHVLLKAHRDDWIRLFPDVHHSMVATKALNWLKKNRERRTNLKAWLENQWFAKEQERGGTLKAEAEHMWDKVIGFIEDGRSCEINQLVDDRARAAIASAGGVREIGGESDRTKMKDKRKLFIDTYVGFNGKP